jgi:hypothetical protein
MREPITNTDVVKAVQDICDATEQWEDELGNYELVDFILNYLIANTDDIQDQWNDTIT